MPSFAPDINNSEHIGTASSQGESDTIELTELTLFQISEEIPTDKIDDIGFILGFTATDISNFKESNRRGPAVTTEGTFSMLHKWYEMTSISTAYQTLRSSLIEAGLVELQERFLHWSPKSSETI